MCANTVIVQLELLFQLGDSSVRTVLLFHLLQISQVKLYSIHNNRCAIVSKISKCVLCIVFNGVENVMITENGSILQWEQQVNADFPTCITSYTVYRRRGTTMTLTPAGSNTSATREDLNIQLAFHTVRIYQLQ